MQLLDLNVRLANLLRVKEIQVKSTVELLDGGATVPFIARYRKEVTGGLSDTQLRDLVDKLTYLRELDERRETILKSIEEQGKLTDELKNLILQATDKTTLEDLYLPYKPKRHTKAQIAREAGLEPLATNLLEQQNLAPEEEALKYLNPDKGILNAKQALEGARYILLDIFAENAELLNKLRQKLAREGLLTTTVISGMEEPGNKFADYFNYNESVKTVPSHRALAAFRGANEGILTLAIKFPNQDEIKRGEINDYEALIIDTFNVDLQKNAGKWLSDSVRLCFKAKIFPSLATELLNTIKEAADLEAIKVFATNLQNLLLMAPAGTKATLGLDPGIRTGVKVAALDNTGKILATTTVYPFQPQNKYQEAINTLAALIHKYQLELISIGNGTASRETEKLVADMQSQYPEIKVSKIVVSEAGASVYSASEYASAELPDLDVSLRGAVSIGRRLQDPLAELVKIDPKSIGVGQYQHDVNQLKLSQSLTNTVEDCVNLVGVEVNTASAPLLAQVSGLNKIIANNIIDFRNKNGKFKNREQLKNVPRLGDKTFEQCAGFLRILNGDNILDQSAVHPESYPLVSLIAQELQTEINQLIANPTLLKTVKPNVLVSETYGLPTIVDVIKELEKPGRDPRGEFKTAAFSERITSIDDLSIGIELEGIVTNVTNFGAFVDIGVHQDGLVHISEIADHYIKNPNEVLKTGQIVKVRVLEIDKPRKRIALSMKALNKVTTALANKSKVNQAPQTGMADAFAKLKLQR